MSTDNRLSRAAAEERYATFDRLARRRRRRRRTGRAVGGTVSALVVAASLVWAGLGLSGLREHEDATSATGIVSISAAENHTCAVTQEGAAQCWGSNSKAQLGDAKTPFYNGVTYRTSPGNVAGLSSGVAAISATGQFSCALTTGGGVKCWGWNIFGALGDGTTKDRPTPVDVSGLTSGVVAISTGYYHACALTAGGGVVCWGLGEEGELGDGRVTNSSTPVPVSDLASGVAAVSAGSEHTCSLTTGGGVQCWGMNNSGQLGDGTTTFRPTPVDVVGLRSGVAAISAGGDHTCALTTQGAVLCWGDNSSGQLGNGSRRSSPRPESIPGLNSGIEAISAGVSHTCALTDGGGVTCWGSNKHGQLGDGTTVSRSAPVSVVGLTSGIAAIDAGGSHTCALTTERRMKCWGYNGYGQLGIGTAATDRKVPVDAGGPRPDAVIGGPLDNAGNDTYNTTGRFQTLVKQVSAGRSAAFMVQIQNQGDTTDTIRVGGTPPVGFRVTVIATGKRDVTTSFLAGTFAQELHPDESMRFTIRLEIPSSTPPGTVVEELVTATSGNDATRKDAVRAQVEVSR
jgi:alpha-tubulin suppressor-like RCC1 family protein